MVFSSIFFLCIFLPIILIGYYVLPKKARNIWLLLGSLAFYAWGGPKHLIFLVSSIIINYFVGILIAKYADREHKADKYGNSTYHKPIQKAILIIAIVLNIGSLVYFKYAGMLVQTARDLFNPQLVVPKIILPLGISFYTFQCMSYIIDVYRKEGALFEDGSIGTMVATSPVDFALYITMFPQLLQGPIIRYADVRDAIKGPVITIDDFTNGIERFIVGLSKKALIANSLGQVADNIFGSNPQTMSVSVAWLGAILYTLQIYFDFSGYSDMAIGLGKLFGFNFIENFNYPYISKSITEFWRRWHISLSNWFRDYLYIPLGGNKKGNVYVNLFIVFLATGIWHGAAWGFLVWGIWHGIFMLLERVLKKQNFKFKLPGVISWCYSMLVVTLGWVLFKLENLQDALEYIGAMFGVKAHRYNAFSVRFYLDRRLIFFMIIAILASIPWAQILPRHAASFVARIYTSKELAPKVVRFVILALLLVISMVFIVNNTYSPFIYFQF